MEEDRNLLDYIYVLVKWRRMIVTCVLLVALATAGISLLLSEKWAANTVLLPHEEELGRFEMSMLMNAAVPGNIGGLLGQSTPGERLVTILKSRRVLGAMVDSVNVSSPLLPVGSDPHLDAIADTVAKLLHVAVRDAFAGLQVPGFVGASVVDVARVGDRLWLWLEQAPPTGG